MQTLADLLTVLTVLGCTAAAEVAALAENAQWASMLFALLGGGIGIIGGYVVNRLVHAMGSGRAGAGLRFLTGVFAVALLFGLMAGTAGLTIWLSGHILAER